MSSDRNVWKDRHRNQGLQLIEARCAVCGTVFCPMPMWVYTWRNEVYCSWHCTQEARSRRESKRKYAARMHEA